MFDDEFVGAAIGIDDSVILSGFTYGSWAGTQAGNQDDRDFVAMSINAEGDVLWRYQVRNKAEELAFDTFKAQKPCSSCIYVHQTCFGDFARVY